MCFNPYILFIFFKISSNSNSDQPDQPTTNVNNKLLAVNIDHYPFEETYNEEDLNINWNPDSQKYTGFLPVTVKATGVPSYTSFYADVDGQLFQQPIQYNGKYKFVLKDDGPFATGLMPQFMRDQSSNNYDININVPIDPSKLGKNTATLKITDDVLDSILTMEGGTLNLPSDLPALNQATAFNANGKEYATSVSIDLSELTYYPSMPMAQFNNGNGGNIIEITENNSRSTFEELDGNRDTIEYITTPENPAPAPLMRSIVLKNSKSKTRDATTSNIVGYIDVNIPPPNITQTVQNNGYYNFNSDWTALIQGTEQNHKIHIQVPTSGGSANILNTITNILSPPTWDGMIENTKSITSNFNISDYNQEHSSNYDGVSEVITTGELVRYVWNGQDSWSDYTIEQYNQENNTNYIGFSSIDLGTNFPSGGSGRIYNGPVTFRQNGPYMNMMEIAMATDNPELETYDGISNVFIDVSDGGSGGSSNIGIITVPTITENGETIIRAWETSDNPEGYDGWDQVTINVEVPQTLVNNASFDNNMITTNGNYTIPEGYTGWNSFNVQVPIPQPSLQSKTIPCTENGTQVITPDPGYDGLSKVTIQTSVSSPTVNVESEKTINVNGSIQQTLTLLPSTGYDALSGVRINVLNNFKNQIDYMELIMESWVNGSYIYKTKTVDLSLITNTINFTTNGTESSRYTNYHVNLGKQNGLYLFLFENSHWMTFGCVNFHYKEWNDEVTGRSGDNSNQDFSFTCCRYTGMFDSVKYIRLDNSDTDNDDIVWYSKLHSSTNLRFIMVGDFYSTKFVLNKDEYEIS